MTTASYEFNSPDRLPPVDCPLVILIGPGIMARAERTGFIESKERHMEYRLEGWARVPVLITGRFPWTYP